MELNKVRLRIGGMDYYLTTDDDTTYMRELGDEVDELRSSLMREHAKLSMTQAAVLVALDQADACKKASASSDNLRVQIKDYLEESARARMEVEVARREVERLNREIADLRNRYANR